MTKTFCPACENAAIEDAHEFGYYGPIDPSRKGDPADDEPVFCEKHAAEYPSVCVCGEPVAQPGAFTCGNPKCELSLEECLRDVVLDGYRLTTWSTGDTDWRRQTFIRYRFAAPDGKVIFEGQDFAGSPLHPDDSDESLRALLSFLTLRPGDTDREYFDHYTPEQMAFAEGPAEALSMWAMDDGPAFSDRT